MKKAAIWFSGAVGLGAIELFIMALWFHALPILIPASLLAFTALMIILD